MTYSIITEYFSVENLGREFADDIDVNIRINSCDSVNMSNLDKVSGELYETIYGKTDYYSEIVRLEMTDVSIFIALSGAFDRIQCKYTAIMH